VGLNGTDQLNGGGGNDQLTGGNGADVLNGGSGIDTVHYESSALAVEVDLDDGQEFEGDKLVDNIVSIENVIGSSKSDFLDGNDAVNRLEAGKGDDELFGGDGDDVLLGGDGNDELDGDAGEDVIDGGAGSDTVNYNDIFGPLFVNLATGEAFGESATGDQLTSIENVFGQFSFENSLFGNGAANELVGGGQNDQLTGNAGNDQLFAGSGHDFLSGGTGNDLIDGGQGNDNMVGGTGTDRFIYDSKFDIGVESALSDVIEDFSHAQGDKIDPQRDRCVSGKRCGRQLRVFRRGRAVRCPRADALRLRRRQHGDPGQHRWRLQRRSGHGDRAVRPHQPRGQRFHPLSLHFSKGLAAGAGPALRPVTLGARYRFDECSLALGLGKHIEL